MSLPRSPNRCISLHTSAYRDLALPTATYGSSYRASTKHALPD